MNDEQATPAKATPQAQPDREPAAQLATHLAALLTERGHTLAVAEGATGGWLSHLLTQVPGSSAWFRAGIVAYTDYAKQLLLRVPTETITQRGSISPDATVQMARLARRLCATNWAIAVTGYADDHPPTAGDRAPGAPSARSLGTPQIDAARAAPAAGLTFLAVSGVDPAAQDETQSWEERILPAAGREAYKQLAAEAAMALLIKLMEGE